jgi:hypothetical protein
MANSNIFYVLWHQIRTFFTDAHSTHSFHLYILELQMVEQNSAYLLEQTANKITAN